MALPLVFNNVVYPAGYFGTDDGGATASTKLDSTYSFPVTVNGTINKVGDSVTVTYTLPGATTPTVDTVTATQYDNKNMIEFISTNGVPGNEDGSTNRYFFSNIQMYGNPPPAGQTRTTFTADSADTTLNDYTINPPVCFARGTLILAVRDGIVAEVAIEDLRIGDLAVTASGAARPIVWVGNRTIECANHPRANEVLPVRIAAHAFAENRPTRDLVVSPGHSIAVDLLGEVLIPASSLINGTTIRQESVERVNYWHVELESHDLLVAENLPTESYLDMGNRGFFPRPGKATALHAVPDAAPATHADFCRPFHVAGPVVDFVRDRLAARALQLDWVQVENAFADLHLVVDGRRVEAEVQGLSARFLVPATAETVWLESDTVVPAMAGGGADLRALGVCVGKVVIDDGFGSQVVMADDPRLSAGFHDIEEGPQRWTAGRARLPADLWEGCRGSFFLRVELTRPALSKWVVPSVAVRENLVALAG